MLEERCFSRSLSGPLPHVFFNMDHDLLVSAGSAFVLHGAFAAFRRSRSVDVASIHRGLDSDVLQFLTLWALEAVRLGPIGKSVQAEELVAGCRSEVLPQR